MVEMRTVPNTKIKVSTICFGTMTFGRPVGEIEAIRLVHRAIDYGVNFIDTADVYEGYDRFIGSRGGVAEMILGKALKGRRHQAIITTKVGCKMTDGAYTGQGLGRPHILRQIDQSLSRLQTDHVDFYLMHRPDPDTPLEESAGAMADLVASGKVRHWGFSNFVADEIRRLITICDSNGWPQPAVSQPSYSWLDREIEKEHLPLCIEHGIAVTPYRVLGGGYLTGKYKQGQPPPPDSRAVENPKWGKLPDEAMYKRLEVFEEEAKAEGMTPTRYAVKWALLKSGITSVILGIKSIAQLEDGMID